MQRTETCNEHYFIFLLFVSSSVSHVSLLFQLSLSVSLPLSPLIDRCIRASLFSVLLQFHLIRHICCAAFRLSFISKAWLKVKDKWDWDCVISLKRRSSERDEMLETKRKENDKMGWNILNGWNDYWRNSSAQIIITVASRADGVYWPHKLRREEREKREEQIEASGRKKDINYQSLRAFQFESKHAAAAAAWSQ